LITPFRAFRFKTGEVITKDDMDQAQANLQWLQDNTPRGRFYGAAGKVMDVKTVVICGRVGIGKSTKDTTARRTVNFGKAFHPSCNPNVTTGVVSDGTKEIFCTVNGPGGRLLPDASGFDVVVNVPGATKKDKWKIKKPFYVYWQAYGFRADDMNDF